MPRVHARRVKRGIGWALWAMLLPAAGDGGDDDARPPPTTTSSTAAAVSSTAGNTPPGCRPGDVEFLIAGEGATAMTVVYVEANHRGTQACHLDTTAVLTVSGPDGRTLHVAENPGKAKMVGDVGNRTNVAFSFVWSACVPVESVDGRYPVTISAEVAGFGVFHGEGMSPRCADG